METSRTLTTPSLGWNELKTEAEAETLHLVIAWSREEPHRIGEAAPLEGPRVLGRGDRFADDPAPRVTFFRQRPMGAIPSPPLEGPRISRLQLELSPTADGRLTVRSVGRCALFINGIQASSGIVEPGDTLTLQNSLVLLVTRRRQSLCALSASTAGQSFPFGSPDAHGIVGESPAIWALRGALAFTAQSDGHVLIQGDSGVGKELAAQAIHTLSSRSGRAFVARNAATFPEGLVDAELFGSARGYPNAGMPERPGLIAEADGGTLFLDEIGELPAHLQAHLLRVLDRGGEYQRLGEARQRRSNLRVVAATNRPVEALKHDFAARFSLRIEIPGLTARREDIPLLLGHLLVCAAKATPAVEARFFERRAGKLGEPRITPELIDRLLRHRYTHHLRELTRLMWLALSTSPNPFLELTPQVSAALRTAAPEVPCEPVGGSPGGETDITPRELDRSEIEAALAQARGSVTAAARRLGLKNRFALYRLIKQHGIQLPDSESQKS